MIRGTSLLALAASTSLLVACGDDATTDTDTSDVQEEQSCEATLRILQKDAYKDTAGRSSELWPPHTTTQLDVSCDGELIYTTFMANHGTKPEAKDAAGDVILVETATVELEGSEDDLLDLAEAFEVCECDAATTFLSMDSLDDQTAAQLVGEVATYLEANLTCTAATTEEVVGWLQAGDVAAVLAVLPSCTWADGTSLEEGLDEALAAVVAATGDLLDGYHVCNNDAVLQVALIDTFRESGKVVACDPTGAACAGPLWLYAPGASAE